MSIDGITTEAWQVVASGLLEEFMEKLEAVLPRDTRGTLERDSNLPGWLRLEASVTLQYAPSLDAIQRCVGYVQDVRYDPTFSDRYARPANAQVISGTTLYADAPPEPLALVVYEWDYVHFTRVGPLASNNQPGAGKYVLVPESQSFQGLPSAYLEIA